MKKHVPDVQGNQVWQSTDPRNRDRRILVVEVVREFHGVERPSQIRLSRFRPNSTGYRLVQDVPAEQPRET